MIGNLLDDGEIHEGMEVVVDFEDVEDLALPQWRRA
jgi:hypothetical protein